jgi:hypothetical protein
MPTVTRKQWLLLLLVLMISYAALTVHSGTHLALDQQSCELCTQHANLSHAVSPAVSLTFEFAQELPKSLSDFAARPGSAILPYHQRAPPRNT